MMFKTKIRHFEPKPAHHVSQPAAVTKLELMLGQKRSLEKTIAEIYAKARANHVPANVTQWSQTLRSVKRAIARLQRESAA